MVFAPVLNLVENVARMSQRDRGVEVSGVHLHSSAVVLPEANHATVRSRWERWTVGNGGRAGDLIDPTGEVAIAYAGSPAWKNISMVSDCLPLNDCIVASVELGLRIQTASLELADADKVPTLLYMNCRAHSCMLCLKPLVQRFQGLSTFLVRVGHLHQSHRSANKYNQALKEEVENSFAWRRVAEAPGLFEQRRAKSRAILELTRCADDLTDELVEEILDLDNGDWDSDCVVHWCLPNCRCGRKEKNALTRILEVVSLTIGAKCPLALEYRWKHMEKANALCYRGRAQHDLGRRAWIRAYKPADIRKAEDAVREAGSGAAPVAKTIIKASSIIEYMSTDPLGRSHYKVLILAKPLESHMNELFLAEKHTNDCWAHLVSPSGGSAAGLAMGDDHDAPSSSMEFESATGDDILHTVLMSNLKLFSSASGQEVIGKYYVLLCDFEHLAWGSVWQSRAEKFAAASDIALTMNRSLR